MRAGETKLPPRSRWELRFPTRQPLGTAFILIMWSNWAVILNSESKKIKISNATSLPLLLRSYYGAAADWPVDDVCYEIVTCFY
jgi:hypothetical protein